MYTPTIPVINYNLIILAIVLIGLFILIGALVGNIAFNYFRYRWREEKSLDSIMYQVAVPRGNEIKIDAMEQLFASLYSIKKGGWKQKYSFQPSISFEI